MKSEENMTLEMSMTQMGMDSLMVIELRRWWKHKFGLSISAMEIMASGNLVALGKLAATNLTTRFGYNLQ